MKIAIIIAGQPRFRKAFKEQLNMFCGYDHADLFLYFWQTTVGTYTDSEHPLSAEWRVPLTKQYVIDHAADYLTDKVHIANVGIGNNAVVEPRGQLPGGALYSQHQSLYQVDQLRQQSLEQYDLVIRTRLDLALTEPIDLQDLKSQLESNPRLVFTGANCVHYWYQYGMCDHIAISSPHNMSIYTNLIEHLPIYLNHIGFHSEGLLNFHLMRHDLIVKEIIPNSNDVLRDNSL
jgi:hypothetical protein